MNFCDKLTVYGCNSNSFVQNLKNNSLIAGSAAITNAHAHSLRFIAYFGQYGVDKCNQCQAGMALFSNYKTNDNGAGTTTFDRQNVSTTTLINYSWTCVASSFVAYLNLTTSWDTKTNKNNYLTYYNYMCNKYIIYDIANGANYYDFKYD